MEGVAAMIKEELGEIPTSEGEKSGKKFGASMASTVVKVLGAAGIGASFAASINEGGKLQQSIGGVETLFGKAADTVKKNAANAWKNVGMSANEYMEQSTSFAASLVSSVGGNTSKAAKLADVAMRDMSDNANKMGTDLESITYAYQGFAKENYTMLDNLKLGYGGTKSEMQRLIADASKLTDVQNKLGISVDGNSMSYDNVIKAIHVTQANLGVMGTTSKEAATTLSGSVGMMKSAWTDFLGNMSIGGDMEKPLQNLISSVITFGANLIPMIGNIINSIKNIIMDTDWGAVGSDVMNQIGNIFGGDGKNLSAFASAGATIITNLGQGIEKAIPALLGEALPMLSQLSEGLRANAGTLIEAGLTLIQNLAQGLITSIPVLIAYVPTIITNLAGIINDNAPKILATGVTIITNLAIGIVRSIPILLLNLPKIITAIVSVLTAFNWLSLGKTIVTGIIKGIKNLPALLKGVAKSAVNGFKGAFKSGGILNAVKWAFTKIPSAIKSIFAKALSLIKGFVGKFKGALKFSWSLPHLRLPHLSVSGGKAPFGIGGKGSLPSFHVSWYKKAMDNPYVFSNATLFGAGEAGDEMLYGRSNLMKDIKEATQGTKNDITINVSVNGADNPEEWGRRMAGELRRQVKMA